MNTLCGANCKDCRLYNKNVKTVMKLTHALWKKCWIAKYIGIGGEENFKTIKEELLEEINSLGVSGMTKLKELYPLHGEFINLEYMLPNMKKTKKKKQQLYANIQIAI